MIISDLSHLEVVSGAANGAGGVASGYLYASSTTGGSVFRNRSFFFKFGSNQVLNQLEVTLGHPVVPRFDVSGLPSKMVGAVTYTVDGGGASAWVAL